MCVCVYVRMHARTHGVKSVCASERVSADVHMKYICERSLETHGNSGSNHSRDQPTQLLKRLRHGRAVRRAS